MSCSACGRRSRDFFHSPSGQVPDESATRKQIHPASSPVPNRSFTPDDPNQQRPPSPKQATPLTATPAAPVCEESQKESKEQKPGSCWDSTLHPRQQKLSLKRASASCCCCCRLEAASSQLSSVCSALVTFRRLKERPRSLAAQQEPLRFDCFMRFLISFQQKSTREIRY